MFSNLLSSSETYLGHKSTDVLAFQGDLTTILTKISPQDFTQEAQLVRKFDIKKDDPLVMARQEQERLSKLQMLKQRGKGPPKKAQGKRAAKRNK
ncbi:hypothetical protein Pint_16949 [Pistacia integerrima]|uniref:Uncharacterized protein n=1 Tax=Pistacia integerrima TaxID=434235 RepID=A0ACC0ZCA5_9ROSI|nr:hypothetical protein Pint_16949 [Pistacia integerrima]